jgi:hypothetical protein
MTKETNGNVAVREKPAQNREKNTTVCRGAQLRGLGARESSHGTTSSYTHEYNCKGGRSAIGLRGKAHSEKFRVSKDGAGDHGTYQ